MISSLRHSCSPLFSRKVKTLILWKKPICVKAVLVLTRPVKAAADIDPRVRQNAGRSHCSRGLFPYSRDQARQSGTIAGGWGVCCRIDAILFSQSRVLFDRRSEIFDRISLMFGQTSERFNECLGCLAKYPGFSARDLSFSAEDRSISSETDSALLRMDSVLSRVDSVLSGHDSVLCRVGSVNVVISTPYVVNLIYRAVQACICQPLHTLLCFRTIVCIAST